MALRKNEAVEGDDYQSTLSYIRQPPDKSMLLCQPLRIDEPAGGFAERDADTEKVGLGEHLVDTDERDTELGGEEDAKELSFGKSPKPQFDFKPLDHVELGEKHDLFDFEAGARVSGAGLVALAPNWIAGEAPALPLRCRTRLRHRQRLQDCVVTAGDDRLGEGGVDAHGEVHVVQIPHLRVGNRDPTTDAGGSELLARRERGENRRAPRLRERASMKPPDCWK